MPDMASTVCYSEEANYTEEPWGKQRKRKYQYKGFLGELKDQCVGKLVRTDMRTVEQGRQAWPAQTSLISVFEGSIQRRRGI
jgi:hypothetical protein